MTIEQIDRNKIKVTVDKEEQELYGIRYDTMTYSDINTRRLCEKIISKACREVGFRVDKGKLLVEAKRNDDGNVTLFLSRLPSDSSCEEYFCQTVAFHGTTALLDALEAFIGVRKKLIYSSLYEYKNKFYLYFEIFSTHETANRVLRDVLEYGERTAISKPFLDEHATCLRRDDALFEMLR